MWSLGVVAAIMLTASLDIGDIIPKLNRLSQDALDQALKQDILQPCLKVSKNGKTFVWKCLQIFPETRLTALEAGCHDWLCTPEKHLLFFQQLDQRILGNWKAPTELKPMPIQLPSVLLGPLTKVQDAEAFFKAYSSLSRHYPLLQTEFSQYFRSEILDSNPKGVVGEKKLPTIAESTIMKGTPKTTTSSEDSSEETRSNSRVSSGNDLPRRHNYDLGIQKRKHPEEECHNTKRQVMRRQAKDL